MSIFDGLTFVGGLCLFLFGMSLMGASLERRAGGKLRSLLGRMTTGKLAGLMTGLGITAIIQSSSATTVMVVGFVNSGIMSLKQAINVIMGANIGTTVTSWILSLAGIDSRNTFVRLLKPSSFVPVLGLIGIGLYMFAKKEKKKDTGMILLGFTTLMFGMEIMTKAVSGLSAVPGFTQLFTMFRNPISGVLAGAALTAAIQSSSASVGILQSLCGTGVISYGAAIPIIMGQNIGTCVTAMLSSIGANKNAKRAALVHLSFNVIGTIVCLTLFMIVKPAIAGPVESAATPFGIAVTHSLFNVLCTALLLPLSGVLERIAIRLIPDGKQAEKKDLLDERLLMTPSIALTRCHEVVGEMTDLARDAVVKAIGLLDHDDPADERIVGENEALCDRYEDAIGTYLVKLSARAISAEDSRDAAHLLCMIGDLERISDHAANILRSALELRSKKLSFSDAASREMETMKRAVIEIMEVTGEAYRMGDAAKAESVEALRYRIEARKEELRISHVMRLQQDKCSIEMGFIWSDLLTDLERIAGHCANIAERVRNIDDPHAAGRELEEERSARTEHRGQETAFGPVNG